jgi:hypothetical protein
MAEVRTRLKASRVTEIVHVVHTVLPKRPLFVVAVDGMRSINVRFLGPMTDGALSDAKSKIEAAIRGAIVAVSHEELSWDLEGLAAAALEDQGAALDVLIDALLEVGLLDDTGIGPDDVGELREKAMAWARRALGLVWDERQFLRALGAGIATSLREARAEMFGAPPPRPRGRRRARSAR